MKKWELKNKLNYLEKKLEELQWSINNNARHQQRQIDGILNNTPKVVELRNKLQKSRQIEREIENELAKRGDDV